METSVEAFHSYFRHRYGNVKCPVCSFITDPDLINNSICMQCNATDSLWFCLICTHVGCGHEVQCHALEHYGETQHRFAIQLKEFTVWDYHTKKFTHILDSKPIRVDNLPTYVQTNGESRCSCPVCRFIHTPKISRSTQCMGCGWAPNLWICVFCNHVGCGRNIKRHALEHYTKTKHPYSMQRENYTIWDYKAHKYLHCQLHDAVKPVKSVVNNFKGGHVEGDQEREWQWFRNSLTEANNRMMAIEKRLMILTNEKKILEEKLFEHDDKLKELLIQFAGNHKDGSPLKNSTSDEHEILASNDQLNNIDLEQNQNKDKISSVHNIHSPKQPDFIYLIVLGFFVYYFFKFILRKVAENIINFL